MLVDVSRGINREKRESNSGSHVDIGRSLEVIRIGAGAASPTRGPHATECIVHDLLRRPLRAGHLANRLLRKDRLDAATRPLHRRDMPRRRQTRAITKTETWAQA